MFLLDILRALVVATHLLANALAGGAPLAAALLPVSSGTRRRLAWLGFWALLLGLTTGGLGVLLVLAGLPPGYPEAAARLPGKAYVYLATEWLFTALMYAAYLLSWDRLSGRRFWHGLLGVIAATNLLYHFPTMMLVLGRLAQDPSLTTEPVITRPVFLEVLAKPLLLGQAAHFWGLSLLVSGVAAMLLARRSTDRKIGAALALSGATALFLSGVWCLAHVSPNASRALLAPNTAAGGFFLSGVACAVILVLLLGEEILVAGKHPKAIAVLTAMTALLMTAAAALT